MRPIQVESTINANIQNEINTSLIFHYLCAHSSVHRARIAEDLGISVPAVSRAVERLIEQGFVIEGGKIATSRGKKAAEIRVNTGKGILIGIDLIKNPTRVAVSDFRGTIIDRYDGFSFSDHTDVVRALSEEIQRAIEKYATERTSENPTGNLRAICIGTPSAVSGVAQRQVFAPLYSSLEGIDLVASIGERYRVPIYLENIVKLSALAEANFGVAREYDSLAFVEVSSGIGLGVIIDDRLITGANGASGELGFALAGTDNLNYGRHHRGFLEHYASVEGIASQAIEAVSRGDKSLMKDIAGGVSSSIDATIVCRAALTGDETASAIINQAARYLSVAIINLVLILDPKIVVIGGDICKLPGIDELFLEPIRRNVEAIVPFPVPPIAVSTLGGDAGVIGASYLAIQSLITSRFPYQLSRIRARPLRSRR
jgi:predicted NBD/HSP70 family sugar kinase